jgi:hypothetical protein
MHISTLNDMSSPACPSSYHRLLAQLGHQRSPGTVVSSSCMVQLVACKARSEDEVGSYRIGARQLQLPRYALQLENRSGC